MTPAMQKFVLAVAVLIPLGFFFGACAGPGGFFGQEAAAWAQAIGTVGAILVAVHAASVPLRAQAARERAIRDDFLDVLEEGISDAFSAFSPIAIAIMNRDRTAVANAVSSYRHLFPVWGLTLKELSALPPRDWPSVALRAAVNNMIIRLEASNALCGRLIDSLEDRPGADWSKLDDVPIQMLQWIQKVQAQIANLR